MSLSGHFFSSCGEQSFVMTISFEAGRQADRQDKRQEGMLQVQDDAVLHCHHLECLNDRVPLVKSQKIAFVLSSLKRCSGVNRFQH